MSINTLREKYVIADKLLGLVEERYVEGNLALIKQAIAFTEEHYALIIHPTGKPYLQYAIEVAINLTEFRLNPIVIAAALVYPPPSVEEEVLPALKKTFKNQKELVALVDDILHLGQLEWSAWSFSPEQQELKGRKEILQKMYRIAIDDLVVDSETLQSEKAFHFQKKEKQVENLVRMFFASASNVHALIVKLVDRLHFIKLLKDVPQSQPVFSSKLLLANITLFIYAPIADRLGIWRLKSELEDMSFRLIQPDTFKVIARKLNDKKIEREQYVNEIIHNVRTQLDDFGIQAEISGRAKHIYSIAQKMEAKQMDFEQINDLLGIRIIIDTDKELDRKNTELCYDVQDILHDLWTPVTEPYQGEKGRDWIEHPKENQYQSLHTTIIIDGRMVEVQIRTQEMHEIAEFGAAATHWRYKDNKAYRRNRIPRVKKSKDLLWNAELANLRQRLAFEQDAVKPTQDRPLKRQIFVLTPNGHVIDLAEGATPLDFAYRIHTKLGNAYVGAKVNGRYVRMDYELKNSDIIEVTPSRTRKGPNPDWLSKDKLDDELKSQIDKLINENNIPTEQNNKPGSKSSISTHQDHTGQSQTTTDQYSGVSSSAKTNPPQKRTNEIGKFLLPEWFCQTDKDNERRYYVFARTRKARSKIRHGLNHPNPQT